MRDLRNRQTRLRRARRLTLAVAILATSTALAQTPEGHSLRLLPPLPLQPISSGHVQPNPFCDAANGSANGSGDDKVRLASGGNSIRLKTIDGDVGLHGIGESGNAKLSVQPASKPVVRSNPLVKSSHHDNKQLVETDLVETDEPLQPMPAPVEPTIHSRGSGKKSKVVLIPPVKSEIPAPKPSMKTLADSASPTNALAECVQPEVKRTEVDLAEELLTNTGVKDNSGSDVKEPAEPTMPVFDSVLFSLSDRGTSSLEADTPKSQAIIDDAPSEPVAITPQEVVTPEELVSPELNANAIPTANAIAVFEGESNESIDDDTHAIRLSDQAGTLKASEHESVRVSSDPALIPLSANLPEPVILAPPKAMPMPTRPADRVVTHTLSDQSEEPLARIADAGGRQLNPLVVQELASETEPRRKTVNADHRDSLPRTLSGRPETKQHMTGDSAPVAAPIQLNHHGSNSYVARRSTGDPVAADQRADASTTRADNLQEASGRKPESSLHYQRYRPPVAVKSVPPSFEEGGALQASPHVKAATPTRNGLVASDVKLTQLFMKSAQVRSLTVAGKLRDVRIADKSVCQAIASGPNQLKLIGTGNGVTQLVVWAATDDPDNPVRMRAFEVHVDRVDPAVDTGGRTSQALLRSIRNTFPNCRVQFSQTAGELIVSGQCDNEKSAEKIIRMVRKTCLVPVQDRLTVR